MSSSTSNPEKPVKQPRICVACNNQISGRFVRALNDHYHLDCFRCVECQQVVAEKFFPIEGKNGVIKIYCEHDYFKRLNLLCAKCGGALRGPHINALGKKYHLDHFTCSICPTVFRQHDQYYERDGNVYCKAHYSVLYAVRCGGCKTSVLKNFVEMERHNDIEQWHPECYMCYKLWKIKFQINKNGTDLPQSAEFSHVNTQQIEEDLQKQQAIVEKVKKVTKFVSAFEESSAECMSNILISFSNLHFEDGILQAAKFICHIETLFECMDEIESSLRRFGDHMGIDHGKEPKQLCRKIVLFFSLLSKSQASLEAREEATKELIVLVTTLARLLKTLIRYSLTGALKLEQKYNQETAVMDLLAKLISLGEARENEDAQAAGLRFYMRAENCVKCSKSVEECCIRFENLRWHSACFDCQSCQIPLFNTYQIARVDTKPVAVYCSEHSTPSSQGGCIQVTQLEQYVFLLRCALSKLCNLLSVKINIHTAVIDGEPISEKMKRMLISSEEDNIEDQVAESNGADPRMQSPMLDSRLQFPMSDPRLMNDNNVRLPQPMSLPPSLAPIPGGSLPRPTHQPFSQQQQLHMNRLHEDAVTGTASDRSVRKLQWLVELDAFDSQLARLLAVQKLEKIFVPYHLPKDEFVSCVEASKQASVLKKITDAFKGKKTGGNQKEEGTFAVPLEILLEKSPGKINLGPGPNPKTIPFVISESIKAMTTMDLRVEGIFRKNGNIKRLKTVTEQLDIDPFDADFAEDNQIQLAALIKKFLRDLPEPLMTFKLHKLFICSQRLQSEALRTEALQYIMCLVPKPSIELLQVVLCFLEQISQLSGDVAGPDGTVISGNKMDLENMATVIAPNILYSKSKNPVDDDSFLGINAVSNIMRYQSEIYKIPEAIRIELLKQRDPNLDDREQQTQDGVYVSDRQSLSRNITVSDYPERGASLTRIENIS